MKSFLTILIVLLSLSAVRAQETPTDIETKSVDIEELISFVVRTYDAEDTESRHITFLLQVSEDQMEGEQLVMLKQSFRLISERLNHDSLISIATYSGFNGIALEPTSTAELELILHTLTDLKGNIAEFYRDGISLAYKHAEDNYLSDALNSVVIIRAAQKAESQVVDIEKEEKKADRKKKRNALMATALALLPEIINLIKD